MKKFFDFLLFGNFVVSLGCASLTYSTIIQLKLKQEFSYVLLTFFSTLFIYNIQRVFYKTSKNNSLNSVRRDWIFNNQFSVKLLSIIGIIGIAITLFINKFEVIFYLLPLSVLSLAYFVPILNFRKNALLKLFTLVLVWTLATSLIPILLDQTKFSTIHIVHILSRFCFMMAICLPFDLRDIEIDQSQAIKTIPHFIGEKRTKTLSIIFILIYGLLNFLLYRFFNFDFNTFLCLESTFAISLSLLLFSNSKRSEYYFVGTIDGLMILEGLLLFLFI